MGQTSNKHPECSRTGDRPVIIILNVTAQRVGPAIIIPHVRGWAKPVNKHPESNRAKGHISNKYPECNRTEAKPVIYLECNRAKGQTSNKHPECNRTGARPVISILNVIRKRVTRSILTVTGQGPDQY